MYLTGREIRDLAEYAGFTVETLGKLDKDILNQEFSIDVCPSSGVWNDDMSVRFYEHVVTCDGCDANECSPLGDPIKK